MTVKRLVKTRNTIFSKNIGEEVFVFVTLMHKNDESFNNCYKIWVYLDNTSYICKSENSKVAKEMQVSQQNTEFY